MSLLSVWHFRPFPSPIGTLNIQTTSRTLTMRYNMAVLKAIQALDAEMNEKVIELRLYYNFLNIV